MRMARAARFSLLGILALLVLCVVLLLTIDLGRFKGSAENVLSDALGREFRIGGELKVHLGRRIHIVAEDVRLAATDWSANADLASVGYFEATIDAWSLLGSTVLIESLRIDETRVYLESNDAGDDNWTLFPTDEPDDQEADELTALPVMVLDASIADVVLTHHDPERPQPFQLTLADVRATQTGADELQLTLDGAINETPVRLTAGAGTVGDLVELGDVDFDLTGNLGEVRFGGEAALDDLLRPRRPTARLQLEGPNAEYLTSVLEVQQVTTGPLDLTATIAPLGENMQLVLNGVFGEFALDVTGRFVDLQDLQDLELRVATSGPDASTLARLVGNETVPADPFSLVGNLQRSGTMIAVDDLKISVGQSQFEIDGRFEDFPDPRGARVTVRIYGPDFGRFNKLLGLPGRLTGPFRLDADLTPLAEGGATVSLQATAQDLEFSVAGDIVDAPDLVGTRVEFTSTGPNLQAVTTAVGLVDAPAQPFALRLLAERVAEGVAIESGTLSVADDRLSVQGLVGNEPLEADTDIRFEMSGPDFAGTLAAFGPDADELPYAQYKAGGRIERGPEYFVLHDVAVAIGDDLEYEMTASGRISPGPELEGSRLLVGARGASLGALTDAAGIEGIPDLPFDAGATIERVANGFSVEDGSVRIGADRINLEGLVGEQPLERDTDVRFDARAPDLKASLQGFGIDVEALPAGEFDAAGEIRVEGGSVATRNVSASLAGADVKVDGRLGALPGLDGTNLTVRVNGADLSRLLPDEPRFAALNKPYGLSVKVELRDKRLAFNNVEAFVEETRMTADADMGMSPPLGSGRFSIDATSPDLFTLVPRLAEMSVPERAPLELHTTGNWADRLWTLDNLVLRLGEGTITVAGTFDGPPDLERTDLSFDLDVASVRNFSVLAGRELPDDPARLRFKLIGTGETMAMQGFQGTIGDSDIAGDFSVRAGDVPRIQVGLRSERLNLAPYLPDLTETEQSEADAKATTPRKDRVIPDTVIPIEELQKYLAFVDIRIAEMILRHRTLMDVALVGAIEDGALNLTEFNIRSSHDEVLTGRLDIRPADTGAELLLAIEGSRLRMGLPALTEEEVLALPKYDVDTVLHGSGRTVRELAGSLDGYARLVAGQGQIRTTALSFFTSDFLFEVVSTINPFAKTDPYSHFQCGAILLRFDDGVVAGRPAAVAQSDRLRIFANANVDLKTEKLDVTINTIPQKGLGISFSDLVNPYTKLGGTLASPSLTLDPEGAVLEGGAAVATAGISLLAKRFRDRYLSEKDPCGKAVDDTQADFQALRDRYYPQEATVQ